MLWQTVILIFVILWWLSFLLVLPFGQVSQAEDGYIEPGTSASAPAHINWKLKLIITTIMAVLLTVVAWFVVSYDLLGLGPSNLAG